MREALSRSLGWYVQGYKNNLSHHWTGIQKLSLEAVLLGTISTPHWYATLLAAENDAGRAKEIWAYGSLVEIYLLAPLAAQGERMGMALEALREMKRRVLEHSPDDLFPLQSTERQLRRYTTWWTRSNGFFGDAPDLANSARALLEAWGPIPKKIDQAAEGGEIHDTRES
jgi:hypothetical protein